MMRLREWRIKQVRTAQWVADAVGITVSALYSYERGRRIPKPEVMKAIITLTGGEVTADSFYLGHAAEPEPARAVA